MKVLDQLNKKQKDEYMKNNHFFYNKKHGYEDAYIKYLFDNNSIDEINDWFKNKVSTISFNGATLISVYTFNKIFNRLLKNEKN